MKLPLLFALPAVGSALLSTSAAQGLELQINEIRIDQPGADDNEYVELLGLPGTDMTGLTYLVVGDGPNGAIESVTPLDGFVVGASGRFVLAEDTFVIGTADAVVSLNFENSDNVTHFLVLDFDDTVTDIDVDDDGVQDVFPWSALIDSVALVEDPTGGDAFYSTTTVGPDGTFVPGHAIRCAGGWTIGDFGFVDDTPGAANLCEGTKGCDAQPNSTMEVGRLNLVSSNIAGDAIDFRAYQLPVGEMGYFVAARNFGSIPMAGGSAGTLCAVSDTARFVSQIAAVDDAGMLDVTLDTSMMPNTPTVSAVAGETWYFQCWHRDGDTSNFTESLELTFE